MNSLEKIVWSQDSYFKTEAKNSGETSINLSNELYEFLGGKDGYIVFTLYKEDYLKATGLISNMLPLYTSTSKNSNINRYSNTLVEAYYNVVMSKFGENDTAAYQVYMFKRDDGRIYLKELKDSGTDFNLRTFLIQAHSKLVFSRCLEKEDSYVIAHNRKFSLALLVPESLGRLRGNMRCEMSEIDMSKMKKRKRE